MNKVVQNEVDNGMSPTQNPLNDVLTYIKILTIRCLGQKTNF